MKNTITRVSCVSYLESVQIMAYRLLLLAFLPLGGMDGYLYGSVFLERLKIAHRIVGALLGCCFVL